MFTFKYHMQCDLPVFTDVQRIKITLMEKNLCHVVVQAVRLIKSASALTEREKAEKEPDNLWLQHLSGASHEMKCLLYVCICVCGEDGRHAAGRAQEQKDPSSRVKAADE